jgi:virginiamycin A acetyltransferase
MINYKFSLLTDINDLKKDNFEIGKYSYVTGELKISEYIDFLKIGKFCSIAEGLELISHGHYSEYISTYPFNHILNFNFSSSNINYSKIYKGFEIGNDVYIGYKTTLHGGTIINDGAIIAAKSVLLPFTNVEPYSIYGGNPAKLIRYRFKKEDIDFLLKLQWWNFSENEINKIIPILSSSNINKLKEIYS